MLEAIRTGDILAAGDSGLKRNELALPAVCQGARQEATAHRAMAAAFAWRPARNDCNGSRGRRHPPHHQRNGPRAALPDVPEQAMPWQPASRRQCRRHEQEGHQWPTKTMTGSLPGGCTVFVTIISAAPSAAPAIAHQFGAPKAARKEPRPASSGRVRQDVARLGRIARTNSNSSTPDAPNEPAPGLAARRAGPPSAPIAMNVPDPATSASCQPRRPFGAAAAVDDESRVTSCRSRRIRAAGRVAGAVGMRVPMPVFALLHDEILVAYRRSRNGGSRTALAA